jgi:hypothetical protein
LGVTKVGLYAAIFLLKKAKRISTAIPNAKKIIRNIKIRHVFLISGILGVHKSVFDNFYVISVAFLAIECASNLFFSKNF